MDFNSNLQQNAFNMQKFHEQMAATGAQQEAQATSNSGGSSFICTALRRHGLMSKKEAVIMTRFMLRAIKTRADFCVWYFTKGQEAVETAERQKYDFSAIKKAYVDEIIGTMNTKGDQAAQDLYIKRAGEFVTMWLGEKAGFDPSLTKRSLIRSTLSLPLLFTLPQVWKWLKSFYGAKLSRKLLNWRIA
jgi:hypothetical protein